MSQRGCILLLLLFLVQVFAATYYEHLDLTPQASSDDIKRSFRKLSLKYHPDKNPNDKAAAKKFADIKKAYEVLSDPDKRQIYDIDGEEGLQKDQQGQGQQGFNPFASFFGGQQQPGERQRGPNMHAETEVTLEELYLGATKEIRLRKNVICNKCRGTGAKDGNMKKCPVCGGHGHRMQIQQMAPGFNVQMQVPCDACNGKGKTYASACPICNGKGVKNEEKKLDLIVERGMPDGFDVVFNREGEQSPNIVPGDLIVKLRTRKHATYIRKGDDLHVAITLSLREALLGFKRSLTQLDGRNIVVERSEVTSHGYVMKIKDEGMPKHDFASEKGNLVVTFSVKMPPPLSDKQKDAIRSIFEDSVDPKPQSEKSQSEKKNSEKEGKTKDL